jgi:hypothetical protein
LTPAQRDERSGAVPRQDSWRQGGRPALLPPVGVMGLRPAAAGRCGPLAGEEIPIVARIVAVADAFGAVLRTREASVGAKVID